LYQSSSVSSGVCLVDRDGSDVNGDLDSAVLAEDLADDAAEVVWDADVAAVDGHDRLGTDLGREAVAESLGGGLGVAAVSGGYRGALGGQALADRGADAAGSAGDQGDPAAQLVPDHTGWLVVVECVR
jgi:hypothetical protein